jgi:L-fuculose-phosphate aldolase
VTPPEALTTYYRWLRQYGINDAHSGNASLRDGDRVWITPTGACADSLRPEHVVECRLGTPPTAGASQDCALHFAVYQANPAAHAILHSHGPHTVALTLQGADFLPTDFEGQLYFPRVPVVDVPYDQYFARSPASVAQVLASYPIMVVRGHGVYACAKDLNLAYKWTCSLEQSAHTAFIARLAGTLQER